MQGCPQGYLAGTATCGLWDLLESIWGPDLHLGPEKLPVADEDEEYEDEEEEGILVEEGTTEDSGPAAAPTRPIPEEVEGSFNPIQEAIKASLQTTAQEATTREEDTPSAPLRSKIQMMLIHHKQFPISATREKLPSLRDLVRELLGIKFPSTRLYHYNPLASLPYPIMVWTVPT